MGPFRRHELKLTICPSTSTCGFSSTSSSRWLYSRQHQKNPSTHPQCSLRTSTAHIHYSDEQLHKMDWELLHLCSTSFTSSALALFHFWSLHAYAANCQTTSPFPTYSLAHPEPTSTKNIKTASPKCTSIDWILILFFSLRSKWMPGDLESIDTDSGGWIMLQFCALISRLSWRAHQRRRKTILGFCVGLRFVTDVDWLLPLSLVSDVSTVYSAASSNASADSNDTETDVVPATNSGGDDDSSVEWFALSVSEYNVFDGSFKFKAIPAGAMGCRKTDRTTRIDSL